MEKVVNMQEQMDNLRREMEALKIMEEKTKNQNSEIRSTFNGFISR